MRLWIALAVVCIACRSAPRSQPALLSDAERAVAGCYRLLQWSGPAGVIPTPDVLLDSAPGPREQPGQRRWRPLPQTPSGRAIAIWSLFRDSVEVLLLEPQPGVAATGYGGRLGLKDDTLAGRLEPLRDFQTVAVDETGRRSTPAPNFRALRVPCNGRPPNDGPGT